MKTEEKREVKEKKTVPDDEANKEIPIKPVKTNVTKPNLKTTDEIMAQKSNWSKTVKSVSAEGKRSHKITNCDPNWKVQFPWIEEVKEAGVVIALLCKECRENYSRIDPADLSKVKSVFINVPFARWDKGREVLFKLEFGDPDDDRYPKQSFVCDSEGTIMLGRKYIEEREDVSGFKLTSHMRFYKDKKIKEKREAEGQSISCVLEKTSQEVEKANLLGVQTLIEVTKLCLELRVAPFNNFKKLVEFMIQHKTEDLERIKRWPKNANYLSNRSFDSYILAIYQTVCFGMWKQMCSTVTSQNESPMFSIMVDTATTLKTNQHVAVGVKYISLGLKVL